MQLPRLCLVVGYLLSTAHAADNCPSNGNNCQRALLRTILPSRDPLVDCNSYFRVTVTPATSIVTYTTTTTTSTTATAVAVQKRHELLEARQLTVTASNIPAYASPCSGAVKYSSACSCIGATKSTVTLATPLISTTTTATVTSTTTTVPVPSAGWVPFGEAMGYQNPVGGVQKSFTLDTQSGVGCNRAGWYTTPTLAELQGGISGPLYVLLGGNDISQAVNVGIWVATANALGRVTVTYLLNPPYALTEVHVDLACLPIDNCNPAQYTYNAGAIPQLPTWSNPTPLPYPACSGGSVAYLVVQAAVARFQVS